VLRSCWFEYSREPLVQPCGNHTSAQGGNDGVDELMRQDAVEVIELLGRAADRHPNTAVVRCHRPRSQLRNLAELFPRVEDNGDSLRRVHAGPAANTPVRTLDSVRCFTSERFFDRPLEKHAEMIRPHFLEPSL